MDIIRTGLYRTRIWSEGGGQSLGCQKRSIGSRLDSGCRDFNRRTENSGSVGEKNGGHRCRQTAYRGGDCWFEGGRRNMRERERDDRFRGMRGLRF